MVQIYFLIYPQSAIIFGKVLMRSKIGLDNIALLWCGKFKIVEADIIRLLQNANLVEIPPEESIVKGIKVDRQLVNGFIDKRKREIKRKMFLKSKYLIHVHVHWYIALVQI